MPKITKQLVDNAKAPETGETLIWDTELVGFGLRIKPSGRKTYIVRFRTRDGHNQQRKLNVCRCQDAPPDKARQMARDIFTKVAAGEDPGADRKPKIVAPSITLKAMLEGYVAHLKEKGKAMADEVERVLVGCKHNAADFIGADRDPASITAQDIVGYVSTYYRNGHRGAADKARGYLHAAYNWAIKSANDYTVKERRNWGVRHNPVGEVARDHGAIGVRDRNLDADELKKLWSACVEGTAGFADGTATCLMLMIACGQRVQETLRLDGAELDFEANLWMMPKEKTKSGRFPHYIPLPSFIIPHLRALKAMHGDGPLFPARADSKSKDGRRSSVSVSHAVRLWVLSKECPVAPFQPRDLRRTWKSRGGDAGVDRFTRDLIQQHAKNDTGSKHYDRYQYMKEKEEGMLKWSAWLEANVLPAPELPQAPLVQAIAA